MQPCPTTSSKKSWRKPRQSAELAYLLRLGAPLEQRNELIRRYCGLAQNGAQCACVEFRMIWHDHLCKWRISSKNNVAAVLPFNLKS